MPLMVVTGIVDDGAKNIRLTLDKNVMLIIWAGQKKSVMEDSILEVRQHFLCVCFFGPCIYCRDATK